MGQVSAESPVTSSAAKGAVQGNLVTRCNFSFHVRPAMPSDENALGAFFARVKKEDLQFRFLTAVRTVSHDQLRVLAAVDHTRTENFLAIEPGTGAIIATAMMAADAAMAKAEVAVATRADFKGRGISWSLLEHLAHAAAARGIRVLESIESRDNHEAIALERDMGWTAHQYPDDATLIMLRKSLDGMT